MLNKKADPAVVGYIREHPAHRLQEQKRLMDEHGISRVYSDLALCIRQRRAGHGDVVAVKRLMLLADPKHKRARGGMRQSMRSAVAAIEAAGATILEIDTGRRRDDPAVREEMMLDAIDQLSRTRYGSDKIGRPRRVWSEDQLTIMKLYWFDHRIATNQEAGDAIRAAGVKASNSQIFKAIGPSKRVAGNPRARQERDGFKRQKTVVYFVQAGNERGHIKIGLATNMRSRLSALQVSSVVRLTLLGTIPGTAATEAAMHERFKRYHKSGEWFRCAGELAEFVKTLKR